MPAQVMNEVDTPHDASNNEKRQSMNKSYTWEEVAEHNTEESAWVICGDKVYDVTQWLDRHPGGKQMLLLFAGRDVTDMIRSYHPFSDKPYEVLCKYEIGTALSTEFPQYKPDSGFYKALRGRVHEYFKDTGYNPKSVWPGLIRLFFMLVGAFVTLTIAYDTNRSLIVRVIAAQLFGVFQALPLLHQMHDASHTAIGGDEMWWKCIGRVTMDWFAGASLTSWYNQHVAGHHLYTNVMGADPDLPVEVKGDMRRVTLLQYHTWFYRFQHIYLMLLYGFLAIKFRIQDVVMLFTHENGPIRVNQFGWSEPVWATCTKGTWIMWRFVLPHYYLGVPWMDLFWVGLSADLITGYFLAFNFQVSHLSPSAVFPDIQSNFEDEWAVSQVKTTVDYAHGNTINTFLSGALNYQTVHHLFPSVSQYHYPALAPIVKRVCKEYNVPFTLLPDFTTALSYHVAHLYEMGHTKSKEGAM